MSSTITEPLATTMDEPLARLVAFEPNISGVERLPEHSAGSIGP